MALNINTIFTYCQQIAFKDITTGYLDPTQFNTFANMANVELFGKYAAIYQDTQRVTDKIKPFIKKSTLAVDEYGHMEYPTDYVDKVAIRAYDMDAMKAAAELCTEEEPINYYKIPQIQVKTIDNNKLGARLTSNVVLPTNKRPIAVFYDDYVQFYPIDTSAAFFEYLRQPDTVVWGYTTAANGLEQYDSTTSVNFEWDWMMTNELVATICSYFGISVREEQLVQGAQMIKQQQA